MKTLVIYAHPYEKSLNHQLLEKTLEGLSVNNSKDSIQVLDLYEEHFDPVLIFNDEKKRRHMATDPDTKKYREQILWADRLVFIYPIWWGRPPAILLGYFDRVLSSGFAYDNKGKGIPKGLLSDKSAICISTMKGPSIYPRLILNNAPNVLMKKAVLGFVGIKKTRFFQLGDMESKKGKQEKALSKIKTYFSHI